MSYIVIGTDGTEIKRYKTVAGAEKAAKSIEGARVVYSSAEAENNKLAGIDKNSEAGTNDKTPEKTEVDEKAKPTEKYKVLVFLNIRSGSSLDAVKVGTVPEGTILEAYEDLGDWLKIRWKDGTAYARHNNHEYAVPVTVFEEKPFKAK